MNAKKNYIKTPIYYSYKNSNPEFKVYYKMECYQPSGSFKVRGMDTLLDHLYEEGHNEVIASSGGNAGYSLAYVASKMNVSARIIVPKTTSRYMISKIKSLGAEVEIYGENWDEANQYAISISKRFSLPYVPPFDHPLLWKGHSSIIDECANQIPEPDKIVVAVGGGGLLSGIFEGLLRNKWTKAKIVTAETEGAASFTKSFKAGHLVELSDVNTIATSLAAKKVVQKTLDYTSVFNIETYVTKDKTAFNACKDFFDEYHVLVAPACGAALSYINSNQNHTASKENILIIVCGGVNMGMEQFLAFSKKYK